MPSQYSTEDKAQALALVATGLPASHAAERLGIPERTVSFWALRMRQIAAEEGDREIVDEDYRIIRRSQDLIQDGLDNIHESGEAHKHLIALNAIKGTAQDKRSRDSSISTHGPTIIFNVGSTKDAVDIARQTRENTEHE